MGEGGEGEQEVTRKALAEPLPEVRTVRHEQSPRVFFLVPSASTGAVLSEREEMVPQTAGHSCLRRQAARERHDMKNRYGQKTSVLASWLHTPARDARSRGKISRCLLSGSSAGIA